MLSKESETIKKICTLPVTLKDISESIFEGVSTNNILMHRLLIPGEYDSESYYYLCEGLCKPVFSESELIYPYVSGAFSEKFAIRPSNYRFCCLMSQQMGLKMINTKLFLRKS